MKKSIIILILSLMTLGTYAQKTATFTSQEYGISFSYDTENFYKVTPQGRNTIFKLESSTYMILFTINVQKNVEYIDFSDQSFIQEAAEMRKTFSFISKVLSPMKSYKYGKKIGAKDVVVVTGKNQYDMVDNSYYFYHRGNLITITFETFEWNYKEYPDYSEEFIKGLKLF